MATASVLTFPVDDQPVFLRAAVSVTPGFHLVATAICAENALLVLRTRPVALMLLDIELPGMDGIAAASAIARRNPDTKAVLLSVRRPAVPRDELPASPIDRADFGPHALERLWNSQNGG